MKEQATEGKRLRIGTCLFEADTSLAECQVALEAATERLAVAMAANDEPQDDESEC